MSPPVRTVTKKEVTTVRYNVGTFGRGRENPPSLGHLREFVAACDGLPDDTKVTIDKSPLDEGGRHTMTFSVRIEGPVDE